MFTKQSLRQEFSREWKKHYELEIFKEKGFHRKKCPKCGRHYWTLDENRDNCGDPPCQKYEFIGNPITKRKLDYVQTWKEYEKFFKKNGHASIPRYPVIDRWRPDLFFTMASIQDFQRIDHGNMVFEYPAQNLVVPQMCLRFNDIPNVGVTGRHHTSFVMSGQHSFGGYWKDRCIELNFRFLTEVMGIPENELAYKEDIWAMPDFSAFGPCIETFSRGLELVNSVFMQFTKSGSTYKELPLKVIDVGWGHERLVWFSQGTPTGYDAVFGPVISWMKKQAGLHESDLFNKYAILAGNLNIDEVEDIEKTRKRVAEEIGTTPKKLSEVVEPMQALYAIADHTRTILFAVTDSGIPSNTGGGYNLRVVLRRALSFMRDFEFSFTLNKIAELHAKHLHPMFPELASGLDLFSRILDVETKRYEKTLRKASAIIRKELSKGEITTKTLIKLYTSNGISPELIEKVARHEGKEFNTPPDFYVKLTEKHMTGDKSCETDDDIKADVEGLPPTRLLYYETPYEKEFEARVLRQTGDWIILDKTLFYPEGGGQPSDMGTLSIAGKDYPVTATHKIGDVVVHKCRGPKHNDIVRGKIDWDRRHQLMRMHTATHIVAGAARKVIGSHIWQAGAKKGMETSRIDLTHYQAFTPEEIRSIEKLANKIVSENHPVEAKFMPRLEAETKYGFVIYQGGASPGKKIRVVNIANGFDIEGCGGMHLEHTGEIELIKIIRTERIQDGVNRIEFTCGKHAFSFLNESESIAREVIRYAQTLDVFAISFTAEGDITHDLHDASSFLSVEPRALPSTIKRFVNEIMEDHKHLNSIRRELGLPEKPLQSETFIPKTPCSSLSDITRALFELRKSLKKELERQRHALASGKANRLIEKSKNNRIFEIVPGTRKDLIELASSIMKKRPDITVILANQSGDVVGMSNTTDIGNEIRQICEKSGGSGGGTRNIGQGKADLSKLLKLMQGS